MNVVSQRCVPVFDVLKNLSTALQEECKFTFPVMDKVLEELTTSAMGVLDTLQELSETKEERVKENNKLNQKATQLRQAAAELDHEITEVIFYEAHAYPTYTYAYYLLFNSLKRKSPP